jgi:hypothetical protein
MVMNETHIVEILDLERQKLAIQHAATEVVMDDKIRASDKRVITAVSGAITNAVMELKREMIDIRAELASVRTELKGDIASVRTELRDDIASVRDELKSDIAEVRTELKSDIARLEQKFDCHAH